MFNVDTEHGTAARQGDTPVPARRRNGRLATAGPYAAPLVVLTALSWTGTLSAPVLVQHSPLLLILLAPRSVFLLVAADRSALLLFLLAATVRLCAADPVNYLIGKRYGTGAITWVSQRGRWANVGVQLWTRAFNRCGYLAVFLRPNQLMLVMAGSQRLRPGRTATAAVTGTVTYLLLLAGAATVLRAPAAALLTSISPWLAATSWSPAVIAGAAAALSGLLVRRRVRVRQQTRRAFHRSSEPASPGRRSTRDRFGSKGC
jgi:hypothetical protein